MICHGEICYGCDQPIVGMGEQIISRASRALTTHAHRGCVLDVLAGLR